MSSSAGQLSTGIAEMDAAISSALSAAMAVTTGVDAKAELSALMDEWEEARQGTTEQLVSIFTKSVEIC